MPSINSYDASDIEVLEGLEPVRKRPGMYIGGTGKNGMHHLFSEVIDNSMDEAVAGYANKINVEILENNIISISDNGRGIPVDKHPKFPSKSALEVILTLLKDRFLSPFHGFRPQVLEQYYKKILKIRQN